MLNRLLDWLAFRLCDMSAWWDRPVWRKRRVEMVYVNARPGSLIELPVWDDRRQMRFERWPGAPFKVMVCDGWRPGRYV